MLKGAGIFSCDLTYVVCNSKIMCPHVVEIGLGSTVELLYLIWHSIEYCEPFQLPSSRTPSVLQVEHTVFLIPVATESTSGKLQEPCLSR